MNVKSFLFPVMARSVALQSLGANLKRYIQLVLPSVPTPYSYSAIYIINRIRRSLQIPFRKNRSPTSRGLYQISSSIYTKDQRTCTRIDLLEQSSVSSILLLHLPTFLARITMEIQKEKKTKKFKENQSY